MRYIQITAAKEGMYVGKEVYNELGTVLLARGVKLNQHMLNGLIRYGISQIPIADEISEGIEISSPIEEKLMSETLGYVRSMLNNSKGLHLNGQFYYEAKDLMEQIVEQIISKSDMVLDIFQMKNYDSYTYTHSVNVSILSVVTALSLSYRRNRVVSVGIGALLHDVGKTKIPLSILNKPSCLDDAEFEEMKKHPTYGYMAIKDCYEVDSVTKAIVLLHHEREDGTGYPRGYDKSPEIPEFVKVVSISDVYDALTSDRIYRSRYKTNETIEHLHAMGNQKFDMKIVKAFLNNIAIYPTGTGVLLNTGEKALVVKALKSSPTRPVIRLIYSPENIRYNTFKEVDMSYERLDLNIIDTCEL